jgi:hypothetical protein
MRIAKVYSFDKASYIVACPTKLKFLRLREQNFLTITVVLVEDVTRTVDRIQVQIKAEQNFAKQLKRPTSQLDT